MERFGDCTITTSADVDSLVFDWGTIHMLCEERVTGAKSISFGTVVLEQGKGHVRHNHPTADEIIFFISGEGKQMLDDGEPVLCKAGACAWIPKGVYHSTVNTGTGPLYLAVAYIPAGAEAVLRESPDVKIVPPDQRK